MIRPKCDFLRDYPGLSARRGLAYDYTQADAAGLWDSDNVSGLEHRAGRLLDLRDVTRRDLGDVNEDEYAVVERVFSMQRPESGGNSFGGGPTAAKT